MDCPPIAVEYYTYKPVLIQQWSQFLFSSASMIVVIYTLAVYLRKSWFEGVFKETLFALYFSILWHDVFTIILQIIQISTRLSATTPCEMQFDRRVCILRPIISIAFPSFVCIHAAVTAQRVVTTFSGNRKLHAVVARACLVVTIFLCIAYVVSAFRLYPLEGKTCFCNGVVIGAENILVIGTFLMMFTDIVNVAVAFLLIRYNRRKVMELSSAPLEVKFRYRQTLRSIQQMMPVALFHLICFTFQYVGFEICISLPLAEVQRFVFNGLIYSMPYYCFICPSILLWLMIREERRKRNELKSLSNTTSEENIENHFIALESQWDSHHSIGNSRQRRYLYKANRVSSA